MFSIFLLMVRIKLTHSFFLIFLVWNLFLAMIPYGISLYLESREQSFIITAADPGVSRYVILHTLLTEQHDNGQEGKIRCQILISEYY